MDLSQDTMISNTISPQVQNLPKEIQNPLLKNNMELNLDTGAIQLNTYNIPKFFRRAYVLTPFKNESYLEELNSQKINQDTWNMLGTKMVLHETNIKIIGNFTHNHNIVIGKSSDFQAFNHFDYKLTDNILIIPILNVSYLNITKYLKVFEGNNNLIDFYKVMVINQLFSSNDNLTYNGKLNITSMITNLEESKYWTKKYNCLFNITNLFNSRRLRFSNLDRVADPETKKIITDIITKSNDSDSNYLHDIKGTKKFVDPSASIVKHGFKLYRLCKESEISKQDMVSLFSKLNDSQKYFMFCNLLISKKYCHLAINNYEIMKQMKSTMDYYARLFKYLIGYSWIRFYMEEGIKKTWMTKNDEFIFDIETASMLPVYPFSLDFANTNPYMPILVDDKVLNPKGNLGGLEWYNTVDPKFVNQGITDLSGFKNRMNLFITGNSSHDIFNNLNWKENGVGISGSIMAACLQKRHPLLSLFTGKNNFNKYSSFDLDFNRYFNEYYAEADVDVMIKSSHPIDFMVKSKNVFNQVVVNICGFNPQNAEPNHVRMKTIKTIFLFVDEEFIKTNIVDETMNYEYVITNLAQKDVIDKFMPFILIKTQEFYEEKFSEYNLDEIKAQHPELFDDNEVFYQIHISKPKTDKEDSPQIIQEHTGEECEVDDDELENDFDESPIDMPNVGINISYKVKISSFHMQRQLELFSLFGDDFFTLVSKFHMPCVRAYYDGENVYMTPSCISAHMTYMNIDYKYFAGSKDPIEIILKYRMRGFGTFLNKNELDRTVKYASKVQFWNNLYNINLQNKNSVNSFFGSVPINSKLFQPRIYNQELFDPNIPFVNLIDGYNNIPSIEPLVLSKHEEFMKNFFKSYDTKDFPICRHINFEGYVTPCKSWLIDSVFQTAKYQYLEMCKKENTQKVDDKKPPSLQPVPDWGGQSEEPESGWGTTSGSWS